MITQSEWKKEMSVSDDDDDDDDDETARAPKRGCPPESTRAFLPTRVNIYLNKQSTSYSLLSILLPQLAHNDFRSENQNGKTRLCTTYWFVYRHELGLIRLHMM